MNTINSLSVLVLILLGQAQKTCQSRILNKWTSHRMTIGYNPETNVDCFSAIRG